MKNDIQYLRKCIASFGGKMDYKMDLCGGCLTCEIACSYKHTGEFNHLVSSIEIIELDDKPGYKVRIHESSCDDRIACDGCFNEEGDPLCVRYCRRVEDLRTIVEEYRAFKHSECGSEYISEVHDSE